MTLRHPDLLRFLSWHQAGRRLELVTEPVRPLAELRPRLTELDVSGGLLAVLRALSFLHEQVNTHSAPSFSPVSAVSDDYSCRNLPASC